ncbi:MAG: class I adenylate-forming enzyme family protein [Thermodesulfobacteriota bacterium]
MIRKPALLMDILSHGAARTPDKTVLVHGDRNYSWAELDRLTDVIAVNLLKMGLTHGDKVALNAPNIPEWLLAFFGLAKIGAVAVTLNVRFRQAELEYMLNQSEARGMISIGPLKSVFGEFDFVDYLGGLRSKFPGVTDYFFIGGLGEKGFPGARSFESLLAEPSAEDSAALPRAKSKIKPDDPALIIYTSGTTGKPKGAVITQKSLIASAYGQVIQTGMNENDSMVMALPLNHVAGLTCAVNALLICGGKIILQPFFIPSEHLQLCYRHNPTILGGVTTMIVFCFKDPSFKPELLQSARLAMTGGSNVEPWLMEEMIKHFPRCKTINLYGLSECSGGVIMSTLEDDRETLLSSIGRPLAGHSVKTVDQNLKELPTGEIGELMVAGDAVTAGYYNSPQATSETFRPEGLLTGDMGYLDARGYVYLKGRKKEMYIQGGYNIYPVEIENLLTQHPKVRLAAGFGVPDRDLGEIGRFYIVKNPGVELTKEELADFLKKHVANYKIPRQFVFVDELPLTPSGKVAKSLLREQYLKQSTAEV